MLNNLKINRLLSNNGFQTERLCYRPADESDIDWIVSMILQPYIHKYWRVKPPKEVGKQQIDNLIRYLKNQQHTNRVENNKRQYIIIVEDKQGTKIGEMSMEHPIDSIFNESYSYITIGYWVCREYQNRGYATEMLLGLTDFILNNNLSKNVVLEVYKSNTKSLRVIEKTNYKLQRIDQDILRFIA